MSEVYGAQTKTNSNREKSTAGGFFSVISEWILNNSGVVYAAVYNSDNKVVHNRIESTDKLKLAFESKYVQSDMNTVLATIRDDVDSGKTVLFVGTPCQVFAVKNCIKNRTNIILIDILCMGVSSPIIFRSYIAYLQEKYASNVVEYHFRDKGYGYATSNVKIVLESGKILQQCYDSKCYANTLFRYYNMRPSCYECQFRKIERQSDFTIGDFVDISNYSKELNDDLGTTKVWVHTNKGKQIFQNVMDVMKVVKVENSECRIISEAEITIGIPEKRQEFFEDFNSNMGFLDFIKKWIPDTIKSRAISFVRKIGINIPGMKIIEKKIRRRKQLDFQKRHGGKHEN